MDSVENLLKVVLIALACPIVLPFVVNEECNEEEL